jgi:hypothetical protein
MPTVAEVLKQAGLDDTQIAALDAKAIAAFGTVMTAAEQERVAAETAQRAAQQMYENEIAPALNAWGTKETNLTAEMNYWKNLAEGAKAGGFIPAAPPFQGQPRNGGGQFVANENVVPGSPDFKKFEGEVTNAFGTVADVQWKYRTLYDGKELPESPTALMAEAAALRIPFAEHVAKKFDFAGRDAAMKAAEQAKRDDAIRAEARHAATAAAIRNDIAAQAN